MVNVSFKGERHGLIKAAYDNFSTAIEVEMGTLTLTNAWTIVRI